MIEPALPTVRTVADLRAEVASWRRQSLRVGLVPTMGALHAGHLSLVARARQEADRIVASVFVNPRQFAPGEDFEAYPRDEARDAALLKDAGCDLLFAPAPGVMYDRGFATTVTVAGVSAPLEGEARPAHFAGVATVVAKLLIQAAPDVAVFGEKDFQQLQVIRRMAKDLDLPVAIVGAPTVRAEDGLALSSRNAYLSADERRIAGRLNGVLSDLAAAVRAGGPIAEAEARARKAILDAGFDMVDYVVARYAEDLSALGPDPLRDGEARVLAAAWIGKTRLIDNLAV